MANVPGRDVEVRLYRDSLTTPWGLRLAGGKDLHVPLTIQRVAVGSPVEGLIHRDDIILEIHNQDASRMTHKQAQDAIRNAGGSLTLRVRRPQGSSHQHYRSTSPGPAAVPTAYDYHPPYRSYMMGKLQDALSSVIGNAMTSSGYGGSSSMSDYGDYNNMSPPTSSMNSPSGVKYPTWNTRPTSSQQRKPPTIRNLMEPGWTPQCLIDNPPGRRRQQQHQQPSRQVVAASSNQHFEPSRPVLDNHAETPAWLGSLRPSIEPKFSDRSVTGFQPSAADGYQQVHEAPYGKTGGGPSTIALPPGAQHLQYNSPLGLYSKSAVHDVVSGQFGDGGAPSNGVASTNSNLHQMVHEHDRKSGSRRHRPETGPVGLSAPAPDQSAIRQSPSIRLLESRFVQNQPGQNDGSSAATGAVGISDF